MKSKDKKLSPKDLSALYGINVTTIYYWIRYKMIAHYRIQKKILINQSEFENFLEKHRVEVSYN